MSPKARQRRFKARIDNARHARAQGPSVYTALFVDHLLLQVVSSRLQVIERLHEGVRAQGDRCHSTDTRRHREDWTFTRP